jgi:outer membrane protein assembly factor BamA
MYICKTTKQYDSKHMRRITLLIILSLILLNACNTLKYVPDDKFLLDRVRIQSEKGIPPKSDLRRYLRQEPNNEILGLFSLNTFWYNLSGKDTSKWINRTLRKIGEAPEIYDDLMTVRSRLSIRSFLISKGYYNAEVDTSITIKNRKVTVRYIVKGNVPYTIGSYRFASRNDSISKIIEKDMSGSLLKPGMLLSSEDIDSELSRIVRDLQRNGYYSISKDYFSFNVDSTIGHNRADIELILRPYIISSLGMASRDSMYNNGEHPVYHVGKIYFMLDVPMSSFVRNPVAETGNSENLMAFDLADYDTIQQGDYYIIYRGKPFVDPDALIQNCRINSGELYDIQSVERTYSRINSLDLMKYVNIRFLESEKDSSESHNLDCYVVLTPNLKQSFSLEVEGTNTAGDLGVAGNASLTHRNLFHGAEMFQAKFRGAYEALSTSFKSDYTELGGELALTFPDFKMPFLASDFKRKVDAKTELSVSYQNMSRPEFIRTVASAAVRYNWTKNTFRHTLDLIDLSYVYMPWVDSTFKANYLTNNSYLKYSYEDHFILRTGYNFSYSSVPISSSNRTYYTWRGSVESAGNSLYAIYSLFGMQKDNGYYKIGNIGFAQYLKGEAEYARSDVLTSRSRFAYRIGLGIAYPFGNSQILPFEKRFFSGGANSVRGWSVRTLGPGSYKNTTNGIDFMNQSGDIKLDLGAEYRSNLFWKVESALFADMGNIWTIRDYSGQPGGQFNPLTFYKQIAGSVGLGVRIDFGYFLVRVDLGMKVYDPSMTGNERWRILSIDNTDDFALHLAFGYPF